jgi:hypothetical protein
MNNKYSVHTKQFEHEAIAKKILYIFSTDKEAKLIFKGFDEALSLVYPRPDILYGLIFKDEFFQTHYGTLHMEYYTIQQEEIPFGDYEFYSSKLLKALVEIIKEEEESLKKPEPYTLPFHASMTRLKTNLKKISSEINSIHISYKLYLTLSLTDNTFKFDKNKVPSAIKISSGNISLIPSPEGIVTSSESSQGE